MKPASPGSASAYARALERHLERSHGAPFVLSPRDWALAEKWHDGGVPLVAVLECLAAAEERRTRRGRARKPVGLSDISREVDETWSVIQGGRVPEIRPAPGRERSEDAREIWRRCVHRTGENSALGSLVASLLSRLDDGEDPAAVDDALDLCLPDVVPASVLEEVSRAVDAELEPFRQRWREADLVAARDRSLRSRIRRRLRLPRISGQPIPGRVNGGAKE